MDQNNEAPRRNPVASFLDVMRSLGPSQRRAVAHELAAARYDFAFAMTQPSREERTAVLDEVLSRSIRTGDGISKREQLHAIHSLQRHLQDASGPEKRERLLTKIMAQLVRQGPAGPSGALPEHFCTPMDLNHPDGPTHLDIWEACQHQWCYMITTDPHPNWLQPTPDQTNLARRDGRHVCLTRDHPLTILLQWSLAVNNHSVKLWDPHVLEQWHKRAINLPEDHNVWRFAHSRQEDGIPAEIHGYVRMLPPDHPSGFIHLFLKWDISRETACVNIGRLQALSRMGLRPFVSSYDLFPSAVSSQPGLTDDEPSDAAEALPFFDQQHRAEMTSRYEAADPDLLQAQPAWYMHKLLQQCGLRDGGMLDGKATGQSHGLAAAWPGTWAQQPDTSSGLEAPSLRERQAEAVAQALLLEEEAAKAKAQAQRDAKQQRRRQKSGKASNNPKLLQDPASPGEAFAASSSGQSGKVLLYAAPDMPPAEDHQHMQPWSCHSSQEATSVPGHGRQISSTSGRNSYPDDTQGAPPSLSPAAEHGGACSQQLAAIQLQRLSLQADPVNKAKAAVSGPDKMYQASHQQQELQHDLNSNGACLASSREDADSAANVEAASQFAAGAAAPAAEPSSISEPQQQQAAVRNEPADTPSSPPWEHTRQSRSRWKDPDRPVETNASSPAVRDCGSSEAPHPAQIQPGIGRAADTRSAGGSADSAQVKEQEPSVFCTGEHRQVVGPGCI